MIDSTNGANPVSMFKHDGVPIISGTWFENIKSQILQYWERNFKNLGIGIYTINENGISKQ